MQTIHSQQQTTTPLQVQLQLNQSWDLRNPSELEGRLNSLCNPSAVKKK